MLTEIETTTIPTETPSVVPSSSPKELSEVTRLRKEIEVLTKTQELMKAINKVIAKAKGAECTKAILDKAKELGSSMTEGNALKLQQPDFAGRIGFASYALTNNNARIKDKQKRIDTLIARDKLAQQGNKEYEAEKCKVLMNFDEDRIQILYPSKPDETERTRLKQNGFHWSPTNTAWQRQITREAIYTTNQLFNLEIPRP